MNSGKYGDARIHWGISNDEYHWTLKNPDSTGWYKFEANENYLGLPAKVITGEVSDNFKERHGSSTFKMWVHKDTGILLNFEEYDSKGEKVVAIKVNDIKLNTPSDVRKFKIQELDVYKRLK
ncbi:hypothetical protein bmyco0003_56550 [Bacillus pseudomycoides]|uniref:hypothetical protein n=1 Tax=Bacillus pseudomycoides TaxID=64104 RepID=UPI0001A15191|nr:hypothetical protein [Bacillus pseudomycoides]EEM07687.1 hypothetical protein bmyco0003_56550 [Bacillus pseudomycoides]PEJ23246.1 hypothetical protein CN887_21310 [Bacillus pseudomycoides]